MTDESSFIILVIIIRVLYLIIKEFYLYVFKGLELDIGYLKLLAGSLCGWSFFFLCRNSYWKCLLELERLTAPK